MISFKTRIAGGKLLLELDGELTIIGYLIACPCCGAKILGGA